MFLYFWWRVALALFTRTPLRLAYLLVAIAADTVYVCWPNGRRAMVENMRQIINAVTSMHLMSDEQLAQLKANAIAASEGKPK